MRYFSKPIKVDVQSSGEKKKKSFLLPELSFLIEPLAY